MTLGTLVRRATKAAALPPGLLNRRKEGDVVILLYHRVGEGHDEIELSPPAFDRQMAYLGASGLALSLDDALKGKRGGVVVTFDDGFADFSQHVVPTLVRHRVPAVLYLATGLVANGQAAEGRLSWSQLRDSVATGLVTIGSHTHNHTNLRTADARTATEEMARSKGLIEEELGTPCRHFAYPWAVSSDAAERAARTMFTSAALHAWRTNRKDGFDPYALGRTPILASDGHLFFKAKVKGTLDGEAFFYRALRRGPWMTER